jgi:hypothetical protein
MATISELQILVQSTYCRIWHEWYGLHPECSPASIIVNAECTNDGYSDTRNEIVISVGDGNMDDDDLLEPPDIRERATWRIWMEGLIHEMLHEYEKKVVCVPSKAGRALYESRPNPWRGEGHEELFYTAVCDRASYFGMTPEELLDAV